LLLIDAKAPIEDLPPFRFCPLSSIEIILSAAGLSVYFEEVGSRFLRNDNPVI
jgi:hypothetical protein